MSARSDYFRGGQKYDTRITAAALNRVADLLDAADNRVPTSVYSDIYGHEFSRDRELGWCWAALLIADITDCQTTMLRQLANGITGIYAEEG